MHCYAFKMYLKDSPLKKEFRMHCYAFEMYLKDSPLRRSSECIDLRNALPKRWSLKEFRLFLC